VATFIGGTLAERRVLPNRTDSKRFAPYERAELKHPAAAA
jgi:hypothetical protein